jgi:hypothetical protein
VNVTTTQISVVWMAIHPKVQTGRRDGLFNRLVTAPYFHALQGMEWCYLDWFRHLHAQCGCHSICNAPQKFDHFETIIWKQSVFDLRSRAPTSGIRVVERRRQRVKLRRHREASKTRCLRLTEDS